MSLRENCDSPDPVIEEHSCRGRLIPSEGVRGCFQYQGGSEAIGSSNFYQCHFLTSRDFIYGRDLIGHWIVLSLQLDLNLTLSHVCLETIQLKRLLQSCLRLSNFTLSLGIQCFQFLLYLLYYSEASEQLVETTILEVTIISTATWFPTCIPLALCLMLTLVVTWIIIM